MKSLLNSDLRASIIWTVLLSSVFMASGVSKIISPDSIALHLLQNPHLPTMVIYIIVVYLPVIEIILGVFLWAISYRRAVMNIMIILISVFSIYLLYSRFVLKATDTCGCFGNIVSIPFEMTLLKNFLLICVLFRLNALTKPHKSAT